jgi:hypothetical protein
VTIDPTLSGRLASELRHRGERHREARKRLHDVFADELGPLPEELPVELVDLSPQALARLTVDLLWPPSQEERRMQVQRRLDQTFAEVTGDGVSCAFFRPR